ncbi:hypothetical protein MTO96_031792 [Rhipicephalus appendiculatus]
MASFCNSANTFQTPGCAPRQTTLLISRRGSSTSTVSSFYSSMCSDASPQASTGSEASRSLATNSSCDPIASGCSSRRAHDPVSSLSTHFRRVHIPTLANTSNLVVQPQNVAMTASMMLPPATPQSMEVLHEQEDSSSMQSQLGSPGSQNTQIGACAQGTAAGASCAAPGALEYSSDQQHPNEGAMLNCGTDKAVEELDDLVLPDELINYLAQRERPGSAMSQAVSSVSQYDEIRNKNCGATTASGSLSNGHSCYSNSSFPKNSHQPHVANLQPKPACSMGSQPKSCGSGTCPRSAEPSVAMGANQPFYQASQEAVPGPRSPSHHHSSTWYCQCGATSCKSVPPHQQPPVHGTYQTNHAQQYHENGNAYRPMPNSTVHMPQPNLIVQPQQVCHPPASPMSAPLPPSPAPQTPSVQSAVATYGTSHSSSCQGACMHRSQSNQCSSYPPSARNSCLEKHAQYSQASQSLSNHKCSRCSNCSRSQPEIQCRSVSQSSRASMPPDTYRRTLEYVQQCQQLAATNAIEGPGVQDFSQVPVQPAAAVPQPQAVQPAIPAAQPLGGVQASAVLQPSDTPAQAGTVD